MSDATTTTQWTDTVTRLEIIGPQGRLLSMWPVAIEFSVQDEGRTLKVFVTPSDDTTMKFDIQPKR